MRRALSGRLLTPGVLAALAAAATALAGEAAAPAFVAVAGPDAEILELAERFELGEDGSVVHERLTRTAVNSYLAINRLFGESWVVWDPQRDRVEVLANRTVLPSGEVVEAPANAVVTDLPAQVHRNPLWSRLRRTVMVHTALEPGAVIECGYRVTGQDRPWLEAEVPLRWPAPVRSLEVVVDVPAQAPLGWQVAGAATPAPEDRTANGRRTLRFRWSDLPACPDEPGSSPQGEMVPFLRLSTATAGAAQTELSRRVTAAGPLPAAAAAAVEAALTGKASFEERVLTVLATVRDALNVSEEADAAFVNARLAPLAAVWGHAWATPLELAALAAAALQKAGVEATVGLAAAPGRDGAALPGFVGFDRVVVALADRDGCLRLVDPVHPLDGGPLEETLRDRSLVTALPRPAASPCARGPVPWQRTVNAVLTVADGGGVDGEVELASRGSAVPHPALVRDPEDAAKQLAALVPAGTTSAHRTVALSRRGAAIVATVKGTLPAPDSSGLVRFPIGEAPNLAGEPLPPLPGAGRLAPLLLGGPGEETVEVTLRLAPGWTVAALPATVQVDNAVGSVSVTGEVVDGGAVRVSRRLALAGRLAPAEQAAAVRELLAAYRSPASRELLLRPPAGWAGAPTGGGGESDGGTR